MDFWLCSFSIKNVRGQVNCPSYRESLIKDKFFKDEKYYFLNYFLKVSSSQIGSAWEWYQWIGFEKDINRYMILIFWFHSCLFEKTSKLWAASCEKKSNILLVRITVGIESCLPIGWRTFIRWKSAKLLLYTVNLGLVSMNYIFCERNLIYLHAEDKVRS